MRDFIVYLSMGFCHGRTQCSQQAAISAGSLVSRWGSLLEEFTLRRFQQNAATGREGFSKVLERFVVMAEARSPANEQSTK